MKVILSRKGFDSEYGGYPSPILPDGRMISLPIPLPDDCICYSEVFLDQTKTYFDLMIELNTKIKYKSIGSKKSVWHLLERSTKCHLDPDMYPHAIHREEGWRPLFGQDEGAQKHLQKRGVGEDDVFLFFGWFKRTRWLNGSLHFDGTDIGRHVIFGYFQIGDILPANGISTKWILYHPHIIQPRKNLNNTIYMAKEFLSWDSALPGAGFFSFNDSLVLTKPGCSRSKWKLPECFKDRDVVISYHNENSWKDGYFQSNLIGQEFVIDDNQQVEEWAKQLISVNVTKE
jgi:hypothetical protein